MGLIVNDLIMGIGRWGDLLVSSPDGNQYELQAINFLEIFSVSF